MKAKNKIITITLLSAAALTGTALINKIYQNERHIQKSPAPAGAEML